MLYDWKENRTMALSNGITEEDTGSDNTVMRLTSDCSVNYGNTFRNFSRIKFQKQRIEHCVFEDCDLIIMEDCIINDCIFENTNIVKAVSSTISNSRFRDITCTFSDSIIVIEQCDIINCTFEKLKLYNKSYLIDADIASWVEACTFTDIQSSRFDKALIHTSQKKHGFFSWGKKPCVVDKASCEGLDPKKVLSLPSHP